MGEKWKDQSILDESADDAGPGLRGGTLTPHAAVALTEDVAPPSRDTHGNRPRAAGDGPRPDTEGVSLFALEELTVNAGPEVAFAHGLIRRGGTTPGGRAFRDLVRVTFCLRNRDGRWSITHRHVSPSQTEYEKERS